MTHLRLVLLIACAALTFAACGDGGSSDPATVRPSGTSQVAATTVTSAYVETPADVEARELACDSFQDIGESGLALRDSMDATLTDEERAEAARIQQQRKPGPPDPAHPDSCEGPIWERYHQGVRARSGLPSLTPSPTTESIATTMTWNQIRDAYPEYLASVCFKDNQPEASCLTRQDVLSTPFATDAAKLPATEGRGQLLNAVSRFQTNYDEFVAAMCGTFMATECIAPAYLLKSTQSSIAAIVKREADAE